MVARTPRTADKTVTPRCERRWLRAAGGGRCGRWRRRRWEVAPADGGAGRGGGVGRGGGAGRVVALGGGSTSANSIPVSLGSRARAHWLPAAAVDQFGEALAVTGTCGADGIGGRIGIADGDGADRHPLRRDAELRAEIRDVRRPEEH